MTVEEKRKAMEKYCETLEEGCRLCPLNEIAENRVGCFNSSVPEAEINEHYSIIFGNEENAPAEDPIKPGYYNDSKITPFEVIDDWDLDFYLGNAVKYIKRAGKKKDNSRLQDLKKIREYVDQEIRKEEASQC